MNPTGYETIDSSTHDKKKQPLTHVSNMTCLDLPGSP